MFNQYLEIVIFFILFNILIIFLFDKISLFKTAIDKPDQSRKIHTLDVPSTGGILLIINLFLIAITNFIYSEAILFNYYSSRFTVSFYLVSFIIFFIGFYDDKYNLKPNVKLILIGFLIWFSISVNEDILIKILQFEFNNYVIELLNFSTLFTIICFLLFINALNMFDGVNLQVGTYVLVIFFYLILNNIDILFCILLVISIICYLYLNYRNKLFLGDNGTYLLGYVISFIIVKNYNSKNIFDVEEIFILMMLPGIDLMRLFIQRIYAGKHPFSPDNQHIHHLLINKYSFFKSYMIVNLLIIIPIFFMLLGFSKLLIILFFFLIYSFLIYFIKKYN